MTNGADAYGKSVWSWLSLLQSSFRGDASAQPGLFVSPIREATETRTNSSPGRARHKPSTHCAGKAGRFRLHLCFLCASLRISSAQRPWVPAGTRSSLHPLAQEGGKLKQSSGKTCRENVDVCLQFEMRIERSPCASTPSCMDGPLSARAFLVLGQMNRGAVMYTASRCGL
jgi:hypothetical protein